MENQLESVIRALVAARDPVALRSVAVNILGVDSPLNVRIAIAARMGIEICLRVDALRESGGHPGAELDTAIVPHCVRKERLPRVGLDEWLRELVVVADGVADALPGIGMYDSYAALQRTLINVAAFEGECDDLLAHRCLLSLHAVTEVHLRMLQGRVGPLRSVNGRHSSRYEKGNVRPAVLETAAGPILGHHQILSHSAATCSHEAMGLDEAFIAYRENLCWLTDWDTAGRGDSGTWEALAIETGVTEADGAWMWRRRNAIGAPLNAWIAALDHAGKQETGGQWLHTGVLCDDVTATVRKVAIVSGLYGNYHYWPTDFPLSLDDYAVNVCACIGEMIRGNAIDHDSEAGIAEHSLYNWLCVDCARRATRDCFSRDNALAQRDDWEMRIAWAPQTYLYCAMRHQGFRRRVDNLTGHREVISATSIRPRCKPICSQDTLPTMVRKLLALSGSDVHDRDLDALAADMSRWQCKPRLCAKCDFDGAGAQLYLVAIGCARLAASLPEEHRDALTRLVDLYGFRLFPALQVRMLVRCTCVPKWLADVMSAGYEDSRMTCGQTACVATDPTPRAMRPADTTEQDDYEGRSLRQALLEQSLDEARLYAQRTGRGAWLEVVSGRMTDVAMDVETRRGSLGAPALRARG